MIATKHPLLTGAATFISYPTIVWGQSRDELCVQTALSLGVAAVLV